RKIRSSFAASPGASSTVDFCGWSGVSLTGAGGISGVAGVQPDGARKRGRDRASVASSQRKQGISP
ncbi:hypothetical protein, partial [Klebsiella pneumoniae]|uniref:hypothetical protein n=1 Tax=Klebsiella pneumoniae TaxID=573 RepID=UPI00287BBE04